MQPDSANILLNNTKNSGLFLAIYHFPFGLAESQDVKQLTKNVAMLMQTGTYNNYL